MAQEASKTAQEGPKTAPRWAPEGEHEPTFRAFPSKMAPKTPNIPPRGPQDAPRGSQEARKKPQEAPKRLPRRPKKPTRGSRKPPRGSKEAPRDTKTAPKTRQEPSELPPGWARWRDGPKATRPGPARERKERYEELARDGSWHRMFLGALVLRTLQSKERPNTLEKPRENQRMLPLEAVLGGLLGPSWGPLGGLCSRPGPKKPPFWPPEGVLEPGPARERKERFRNLPEMVHGTVRSWEPWC